MRVTECAQRAVRHARGEAGRLGHDQVGTEHLLLALLRDQACLATAILGERGVEVEAVRRRVEQTAAAAPGSDPSGERDALVHQRLPTTRPFTLVLGLAGREALELEHDRVGTEHLLLGLAREGDGVAAQVLEDFGAGLLQLREAVISVYSAGVDPLPLTGEHLLPSGDRLVLLSLEIWSDWFDLRYAVVYATPGPDSDLTRPSVLGRCEVSDRAGTEYVNWVTSSPAYGTVRVKQHTSVPAPPPGTEVLELRFLPPAAAPGEGRPLVVSTVLL